MPRIIIIVISLGLILAACTPQTVLPVPQATYPVPQPTGQPTASQPGDNVPPTTVPPPLSTEQPYAPQPGDSARLRQEVYLDSSRVHNLSSDPAIIVLDLQGNLPSPCNALRIVVSAPNAQNQIMVDIYSVIDPGEVCITIIQPFNTSVILGKFPSGHYTVWVNGKQVGEFVEK